MMRRTLVALAVCGALLSSSTAAASAPTPVPQRYGEHPRQNITVYGRGGPALMIVHGGYWAQDADWSGRARWFAARGFTVYDTDYRLTPDAVWPAQRDDLLAAVAWVRSRHGSAPLVLGSSAGGHLATQAGTYRTGAERVRGVVALSPVATPYRAWRDGGRPGASDKRRKLRAEARRLADCAPARCPARWDDLASGTHASGGDAPLLMLHSAGDFVPVAHARDLAAAGRRGGLADVTVREVAGDAHGGRLLKAPGVAREVLAWLRAHG